LWHLLVDCLFWQLSVVITIKLFISPAITQGASNNKYKEVINNDNNYDNNSNNNDNIDNNKSAMPRATTMTTKKL
jgi:hypothetical protein